MYIILICLYAIGRGLGGENKTFIIIESLKAKVCYIQCIMYHNICIYLLYIACAVQYACTVEPLCKDTLN